MSWATLEGLLALAILVLMLATLPHERRELTRDVADEEWR